jgi:SprT protein
MTDKDLIIFKKYLPGQTVHYCSSLWSHYKFKFIISKPRQSKLGDYSFHPAKGHTITVNSNLNPYSFLITYLHEIAHLVVQTKYTKRKAPHGAEWKEAFRNLLDPVMIPEVFPTEILLQLKRYYKNPAASTHSHSGLSIALSTFDAQSTSLLALSKLPTNGIFELNNRYFKKGTLRRTRFLCLDLETNKQYLILGRALVLPKTIA